MTEKTKSSPLVTPAKAGVILLTFKSVDAPVWPGEAEEGETAGPDLGRAGRASNEIALLFHRKNADNGVAHVTLRQNARISHVKHVILEQSPHFLASGFAVR